MAAVFDRSGSGGHRAVMASASPMASAPVTGSATASASAAPVAASASASSSASSGSSGSSEAAKDADGIDAALRGKSSKEKLDSLMGGFDTFQHVMREGTRQRREKDEHRLAELRDEIAVLERSIVAETQKREEMGRGLQEWAANETSALEARLRERLVEQEKRLEARIAELHVRLDSIEVKFAKDRETVLAEVERRNHELTAKLEEFHAIFDAEKAERRRREAAIEAQIASAEHSSEEAFREERSQRERVYMELRERLDHALRTRAKADEKLRVWIEGEVADIRTALRAEVVQREAEDDDILGALTRYAQKLQASLHIINASDTELQTRHA